MYRIENVAVTRLKEYENNPRNNDIAVDKVAASIKRLGFLFPIVIDINYVIVCGHTRKKACEQLGIKNVPCIRVDDLSPDQVRYFRLVDNRTSEYAEWDFSKLEEELKLINLDVVENFLLLEAFDLETTLTDFDDKMAEIEIEGYNFLAANTSDSKKGFDDFDTKDSDNSSADGDDVSDKIKPQGAESGQSQKQGDSFEAPNEEQSDKLRVPSVLTFEVGKIRFCISKVELEMLNNAYAKYMDTAYPSKTFIDFILGV